MTNYVRNPLNIFTLLLVLLTLTANSVAYARQCNDNFNNNNTQNLDDNENGSLTNIDSGLTWMRCSLGQHWNGHTCLGQAKAYTWQDAHTAAQKLNQAGGFAEYADWRLPRLPELAGIVAIHCKNPRINLQLFPATPATFFWTATTKQKNYNQAYVLDFAVEGIDVQLKNKLARVRLVRGRK